jgi:hypothetical protein
VPAARPSARKARIIGAVLAFLLTFWFGVMVFNFRVVGTLHALGVIGGTVLMAVWAAICVQRVMTSSPPAWLRRLLQDGELIVGFLVLNLILLNVFSPFLMLLSQLWLPGSVLPLLVGVAGRLSGRVLFVTFVVATGALLWLSLVRLGRRVVPESPALRTAQRAFSAAAIAAVAVYGIYSTVLSFNGSLDSPGAVAHKRELVAVTTVHAPLNVPVSWIDVRSADGRLERITLLPGKDGVWAGYVDPGQPVVVRVRPGFFGIPWIEQVSVDQERRMEQLVEAAPSAAVPRRALIGMRLHQGRWAEAVEHTRAHLRYYPREKAFAATVAATLRASGQTAAALEVERLAGGS